MDIFGYFLLSCTQKDWRSPRRTNEKRAIAVPKLGFWGSVATVGRGGVQLLLERVRVDSRQKDGTPSALGFVTESHLSLAMRRTLQFEKRPRVFEQRLLHGC